MPYKKGESGNPNGRPPKPRALAKILETAGRKTLISGDGKKISRKNLLAEMIWTAATTGRVEMPDKSVIAVSEMGEWLSVVKFLHMHIDGPAKAELDVTSANQPLVFNLSVAPARPVIEAVEPDEDDE